VADIFRVSASNAQRAELQWARRGVDLARASICRWLCYGRRAPDE